MYREVLAAAEERSVVIAAIGFALNVSSPDLDLSRLSSPDLARGLQSSPDLDQAHPTSPDLP